MKTTRVQKILIKKSSNKKGFPCEKDISKSGNIGITYGDYFNQIDELSLKARNLYNHGNYIVRKEFFNTSKEKEQGLRKNANWIRYNELDKICQKSEPYKKELNDYKTIGCSGIAQHTLKIVDRNWKSFFASIKDWKKNPEKYTGRPKPPKYLKGNTRIVVELTTNQIKNKDGYVFFSFSYLKNMNNTFKLRNSTDSIKAARFVPIGDNNVDSYRLEIIQEVNVEEIEEKEFKRIAGIDLGINNLLTVTTNCGVDPIVINGKPLKAINTYYNKTISKMKSELMIKNGKYSSKEIIRFTNKRNRKVEDYIHKASKKVVDWCVENNIEVLVCGHNKGWKQEADMGKMNNQTFVQIPHSVLIQKLQYKCENVGIKFIEIEEGYTSGTSFIDKEKPTKEYYNKNRRKYRGLFISNEGVDINADVNGSYQIIKKAFPDAFNDNTDYKRHPEIVNL